VTKGQTPNTKILGTAEMPKMGFHNPGEKILVFWLKDVNPPALNYPVSYYLSFLQLNSFYHFSYCYLLYTRCNKTLGLCVC